MSGRRYHSPYADEILPDEDEDIDEGSWAPVGLERALDAPQYWGEPQNRKKQNDPVIGKRIELPLNAAGTAVDITDLSGWRDLVRGYYAGGALWQLTLAPVEQVRPNPAATLPFTSLPLVRMQFGGGGVATELLFNWPVLGASFVLPAEVVSLAVRGTDATPLVVGAGPPIVSAWLQRQSRPTFPSSFFLTAARAVGAIGAIAPFAFLFPFAKRLHVGDSGSVGGFTVQFRNFAGAIIWEAAIADTRYVAVPVPADAQTFSIIGLAPASVSVTQEISFT